MIRPLLSLCAAALSALVVPACKCGGVPGETPAEQAPDEETPDASSPADDLALGDDAYADGDFVTALALYREVAEEEPEYARAYDRAGAALFELGRIEQALASFDRALELDAANAYAHSHRALALAELGRRDEALASFDRAIALEPEVANFREWREQLAAR